MGRCTWNEFKQRGTIKSDWRKLCEFLLDIPTTTVYREIAEACGCDEDTAEEPLKTQKEETEQTENTENENEGKE